MINYRKRHPRSEYVQPIVPQKTVDPTVATWTGVFESQAGSFRTNPGKQLDVRLYDWGQKNEASFPTITSGITTLGAVWQSQANSFRTPQGKTLDVRLQPWTQDIGYIYATLGQSQAVSFDSPSQTVYKRTYPRQPQTHDISFIQPLLNSQVGPTIAQFAPPSFGVSYTTPKARQDLYTLIRWENQRFGIPFDPALLVGPYSSYASYRTPPSQVLDVRSHGWVQDTSYIARLQVPTLASFYPAWAQLQQSFRTPDRPVLQVTRHIWDVGTAWEWIPATSPIPSWTPAFVELQRSFQTRPGRQLDVRYSPWSVGDNGWMQFIIDNPPPPPPTHIVMSFDCASMVTIPVSN